MYGDVGFDDISTGQRLIDLADFKFEGEREKYIGIEC
jgi:hypothetical protein